MSKEALLDLKAFIAAAPEVKDVNREQKFTRALAWDKASRPPNDVDTRNDNDGGRKARAGSTGSGSSSGSGGGGSSGGGGGGSGGGGRSDGDASSSEGDKGAAPAADKGGLVWPDGGEDPPAANRDERRRRAKANHGAGSGGANPGRLRTRPTIGLEPPGWAPPPEGDHSGKAASYHVAGLTVPPGYQGISTSSTTRCHFSE